MTLWDKRIAVGQHLRELADHRMALDYVGMLDTDTLVNGFVANATKAMIEEAYEELCGAVNPEEQHTNQILMPKDDVHLEGGWD